MRNGALPYIIITILILFALDFYVYRGIKRLTKRVGSNTWQKTIFTVFWGISCILLLTLLSTLLLGMHGYSPAREKFFMFLIGSFIITVIPKLVFIVFQLIDDVRLLIMFLVKKKSPPKTEPSPGEIITRGSFITWIGAYAATVPFASIAYGMMKGKYDFRVLSEKISFPGLPPSFHGIRIVQISDLHVGSFFKDHGQVKRAIQMVNDLKPDILFFTGDMVNNYADETDSWMEVLQLLKAKYGKYAIFGNHDYADYVQWESKEEKEKNAEKLKGFIAACGFRLLLNESVPLILGDESITIIGVENWGKAKWSHKYGDLKKAMKDVDPKSFTILLSHDPSHWDAEVLGKANIPLTLSGHTHGMQFGVEIGNIKWSPVQNFYPRWGGLYEEGEQYLYVNRGLGFIGFPGRVGMPPEITLIELFKGHA